MAATSKAPLMWPRVYRVARSFQEKLVSAANTTLDPRSAFRSVFREALRSLP